MEIKFLNKKKKNNDKLKENNILIFDESSMIENNKIRQILDIIENKNLKIFCIFVGDKNQLNPVNENENYILENSIINLEKNMRCNINSINNIFNNIIDEINNFNDNYNYINFDIFISNLKNNLQQCTNNIKIFDNKDEFILDFIKIYKNQNSIISTYTNKECDNLNSKIKNIIVENDKLELIDKYYIGQQIIFMEPYSIKNNHIIYNTSEIAYIKEIKKKHLHYKIIQIKDYINLFEKDLYNDILKNYIDLEKDIINIIKLFNSVLKFKGLIISIYNKNKLINDIEVLNSKEIMKFEDYISTIENEINKFKKKYKKDIKKDKEYSEKIKLLDNYIINNLYELLNIRIKQFAKINDGYSLTVHKSQGITVDNVYVNLEDILTMNDIKNKLKCIYTAFTRCSNNLIIYLLNNPICKCYKFSSKYIVKSGNNSGNIYWKCDKCKYFKWNNDLKLKII